MPTAISRRQAAAAPRDRGVGRRRQVDADRADAARRQARCSTTRSTRCTATGRTARPTSRRSPTGCAPSASRASRSTSPTATSRRRGARSSSPTRPGHQRYTRNMVTGASTAHLAVILIDARNGIVEQSRRHATLSSLLGIRHLVAARQQDGPRRLGRGALPRDRGASSPRSPTQLGVEDARAFPISALHGDNVVEPRRARRWYDGPPLLEHLEEVDVAADRGEGPLRLPVQWVIRPEDAAPARAPLRRARSPAAAARPATRSSCCPAGARTTVDRGRDARRPARARRAAGLGHRPARRRPRRRPRRDASAASTTCRSPAATSRRPSAGCRRTRCAPASTLALKHTTRTVRAAVESIDARSTSTTLNEETPPDQLAAQRHRAAHAAHERAGGRRPLRRQPHDRRVHPVDEDSNDTVAAGMVREIEESPRPGEPHSPRRHLARHRPRPRAPLELARHARRDRLDDRPARVGQVERRGGARAAAGRGGPCGVLPRRRQPAPRDLRRPRVLARRPDREHPPRRPRGAPDGGRRHGLDRVARLPRPSRPRARPRAARGGGPAVPRGLRRHPGRGLRGARPEGALRAGTGRQAARLHRRERAVRGARAPGRPHPRRGGGGQGGRLARTCGARAIWERD